MDDFEKLDYDYTISDRVVQCILKRQARQINIKIIILVLVSNSLSLGERCLILSLSCLDNYHIFQVIF